MTHADTLRNLAARVEALTGPCRETDGDIAEAMGIPPDGFVRGTAPWAVGDWVRQSYGAWAHWTAPAYTASLDAAAGLVPAGCGWHVDKLPPQTPWASIVRGGVMHDCHGATSALALTAAALRARAEEAGDA